jgi:GTPase KRas protein
MCDREYERQVSKEEGEALAKGFGCPFLETSAKSRRNVDEAFYEVVREIRRYNKEMADQYYSSRPVSSGNASLETKDDSACALM